MPTTIELARLAAAINLLRPDWPTASVQTFLAEHHAHRPLHDLAVAITWVATDPASSTPKRLNEAGPWWQASRSSNDRVHIPPCPAHGYTARRPDGTYPCCDTDSTPAALEREPTPPPRPLRELVNAERSTRKATPPDATRRETP